MPTVKERIAKKVSNRKKEKAEAKRLSKERREQFEKRRKSVYGRILNIMKKFSGVAINAKEVRTEESSQDKEDDQNVKGVLKCVQNKKFVSPRIELKVNNVLIAFAQVFWTHFTPMDEGGYETGPTVHSIKVKTEGFLDFFNSGRIGCGLELYEHPFGNEDERIKEFEENLVEYISSVAV